MAKAKETPIPEAAPTAPSPVIVVAAPPAALPSEVPALRARIAELEAFIRSSVHHGLNYTAAHEILKKA